MKARIHISINDTLLSRLDELCALRHFNDRSAMLEHLIREEWELRGAAPAPAAPINYPAAPGPDQIVAEAAARTIAAARAAVKRRPPAA